VRDHETRYSNQGRSGCQKRVGSRGTVANNTVGIRDRESHLRVGVDGSVGPVLTEEKDSQE
jgi:hypothetical protein